VISRVDILVNPSQTELKINNKISGHPESSLVEEGKEAAEKYFQGFTTNQLKITYILWTEALSFEELDSKEAIEADCLEVWLGEQLKPRQEVMEEALGKLLYPPIQALAIENQKNQLLSRRFVTEKELGIHEWKIKNTFLGNGASLIGSGQKMIRPNVYYQDNALIFASNKHSSDQIIFPEPFKGIDNWVSDKSKRYLMKINHSEKTALLLDTEKMIKQNFTQLGFLAQVQTA